MGRLVTTCAIRQELMAIQYDQESTLRTYSWIYPSSTSAYATIISPKRHGTPRNNQKSSGSRPRGPTTSANPIIQRNKIPTIQRGRKSLARRDPSTPPLRNNETRSKAVWTFQGSRQDIRRRLQIETP